MPGASGGQPTTAKAFNPTRHCRISLLLPAVVVMLLLASSDPTWCRSDADGVGGVGRGAVGGSANGKDFQARNAPRNLSFQTANRTLKSPTGRVVVSSPSVYLDFRSRRRKRRKRIRKDPPPTKGPRILFTNSSLSTYFPSSSPGNYTGRRAAVSSDRRKVPFRRKRIETICKKSRPSGTHRCFKSSIGSRRVPKDPRDRRWWRRRKGNKGKGSGARGRGKSRRGRKGKGKGGKRKGKGSGIRVSKGKRKVKGGQNERKARRPFFVAGSTRRRVLPNGSAPRYSNARLYGRWSRWSPCSRSCTTQRFRWCKRPLHCGADVVREEAYCYVEGSFCHRWIHRQIQQQPDTDDNEAGIDPSSEELQLKPMYSGTPITSGDLLSQRNCGISPSNNRTSLLTLRRHQQALRIIGGRESMPGRWPWQVAVLNRFKEAFCGGTLVAPHWILTAAHCVRKRLYVRLGEHDLVEEDGTETEFRVEEAVIHPDYDADTVDNDVALLRLPMWASSGENGGGHGFACLPRPRQALPLRRLCTIIGWGKRKSSDAFGTDILHEAEVPIVSNEVCRDVYEDYYITGNMFCAGYHKGRMDSCAGDSGGPLLCLSGRGADGANLKWTIFGITSFGEGCGKRGKYGIYTKVSNYVRWVQRVVKSYYGNGS